MGRAEERRRAARPAAGQLPKHYAPAAKLSFGLGDDADLRERISRLPGPRAGMSLHSKIPSGEEAVSVIPHDAEAFARAHYAELHRCDERERAGLSSKRCRRGGSGGDRGSTPAGGQ